MKRVNGRTGVVRKFRCATHRFNVRKRLLRLAGIRPPLQDRYGRVSLPLSPLERVFRRALQSTILQRFHTIHLAPQLSITLGQLQQVERRYYERERLSERVLQWSRRVEYHQRSQRDMSLVTRMIYQYQRLEGHHRPDAKLSRSNRVDRGALQEGMVPPSQPQTFGRVDMVLKRATPVAESIRPPQTAPANADPRPFTTGHDRLLPDARRSALPADFSPDDLQRLTDQVVTRLDARVLAQRERMGKR